MHTVKLLLIAASVFLLGCGNDAVNDPVNDTTEVSSVSTPEVSTDNDNSESQNPTITPLVSEQ